MNMLLTKARPYAKAIFSLALEHDQLLVWQELLQMLAMIAGVCKEANLLDNPTIAAIEKVGFFAEIVKRVPEAITNLVRLLVERKKIYLLSGIAKSYRQMLLAYNNTVEVKIILARELNGKQKEHLRQALRARLRKEVLLQCHVDAALIGGAVLYFEDKVLDGSIKGMLQRLRDDILLVR